MSISISISKSSRPLGDGVEARVVHGRVHQAQRLDRALPLTLNLRQGMAGQKRRGGEHAGMSRNASPRARAVGWSAAAFSIVPNPPNHPARTRPTSNWRQSNIMTGSSVTDTTESAGLAAAALAAPLAAPSPPLMCSGAMVAWRGVKDGRA